MLASLYLLPPAIRAIIESHPLHFLYGSIAADISFAKKYVPEGRHCHHWHVGEEILAAADSPRLRAVWIPRAPGGGYGGSQPLHPTPTPDHKHDPSTWPYVLGAPYGHPCR